jgi:hypothetical protein
MVDFNDAFAPDKVDDPAFGGIDKDCPPVCLVHELQLCKCIAFGGTNTGHKFYMCQHVEVSDFCVADYYVHMCLRLLD